MKILNLAPRKESHDCYKANQKINSLISQTFTTSVKHFIPNEMTVIPFMKEILTIGTPHFVNSTYIIPSGDLKYSSTTLRDGGCAVFCFHQGLTTQNFYTNLEDVSNEIAKKDYYEPNKGTWHCLFDHFGLRRASNYTEIIFALLRSSISTCLVSNAIYHNDSNRCGKHFVNVVGIDKSTVYIDDSNCGRFKMDFETFLKSVQIAWIW